MSAISTSSIVEALSMKLPALKYLFQRGYIYICIHIYTIFPLIEGKVKGTLSPHLHHMIMLNGIKCQLLYYLCIPQSSELVITLHFAKSIMIIIML